MGVSTGFMLVLCFLLSAGCGYRAGKSMRTLPGGYEQVSVPIFENQTQMVAIEPFFTNALIEQFETSKIAKVVGDEIAPVKLKGRILQLNIRRNAVVTGGQNNEISQLPEGTSLATSYRIAMKAEISMVRASDSKVLWSSFFDDEIFYQGPRVGEEFVNSVNANYNHSVRRQKVEELANQMMQEAHDRVTENF
ncbi:MAG: LptE family protein [Pseudomonadota bacterium]